LNVEQPARHSFSDGWLKVEQPARHSFSDGWLKVEQPARHSFSDGWFSIYLRLYSTFNVESSFLSINTGRK